MRPLYASLAHAKLSYAGGNAGLWYDKFCDEWGPGWSLSSDGEKTPKRAWIASVANGKDVGDRSLLAEAVARLHELTEARSGICSIFTTESRFVTGLGRNHPVENGFAWHPTLGVPYLPGSSVKGLVRAWATHDADPAPSETELDHLLGRADALGSAGHVIFLDAIPAKAVRLEADVMTPHYAGWKINEPPGDWREPNPVPFLVVAPETPFLFSLLPRGVEKDKLAPVFRWLTDALRNAGAGAKTAVGYGRFANDERLTKAWNDEREQRQTRHAAVTRRAAAAGTPEGRWLDQLQGQSEAAILELVRVYLEVRPIADLDERRSFARAVATTPYVALWRKGTKQDKAISAGPDKLKGRARCVDAAASVAKPE